MGILNKRYDLQNYLLLTIFLTILAVINFLGLYNPFFFHFLMELITIVFSCCLFAVIWVTREKINNGFFSIIGIGLFFASCMDILHTLSFKGPELLPHINLNQSLYFWLAARLLQSLTFFIAPFFAGKRPNYFLVIGLVFFISTGCIYFILNSNLPLLMSADENLSKAREIVETLIFLIFFLSLIHTYSKREQFTKIIFRYLSFGIIMAMASEAFITINASEAQLVSIIGLDLKTISYLLIFQIVMVVGFQNPQEVFYWDLQSSWELLQSLFNSIDEGICILDQSERIIQTNPAAERILGGKSKSLVTKSIYNFFNIDQDSEYLHQYAMLKQNQPVTINLEITGSDLKRKSIEFTAIPRKHEKQSKGYYVILRDITEQRDREKCLEEANVLYQTLFMDSPIRTWEFDFSKVKIEIDRLREKGIVNFKEYISQHPQKMAVIAKTVKITAYNNLVAQTYSKNVRNKKTIKSLVNVFTEESYKRFISELVSIADGITKNKFEAFTQSSDGSIHYNVIHWAVLPGHEADYARVIVSADDITDRRKAELELQTSEAKFRLLAENSDIGLSYFDTSGNLIYINNWFLEVVGINDNDYQGKNVINVFRKALGQFFLKEIRQSIDSGSSQTLEKSFTLQGREVWLSMIFSRVLDNREKCVGVQVIANDITHRKELEQQLLSLARFPEENPYPVMRFSTSGTLLYANRSSEAILKSWDYDNQKYVPKEIQTIINNCIDKNEKQPFDVNVQSRMFNLIFAPISDMGYVNVYGRDVTEQRLAEIERTIYSKNLEKVVADKTDELVKTQERLVRQEKLAVMGQLASGVGHELRNPLAVINNALYMLRLANNKKDPTTDEYLNIIDQEVAASNKIISDLLTFARIKPANLNPVNVSTLLDTIFTKFVPPENIVILNDLTNKTPSVYVDEKQIEQIVTNLITNAYQAMPEEGSLSIKATPDRNLLRIDFIDTGVGITPENLEKIFEPLFTTKAKGIGLGLTISKMLAEINGGKIKVKSKPGQGATFSLFLPINKDH